MTALLYYSYSRRLSENELVEIDRRVSKNKESVYLFLTELPSNSKRRAKRLCLYVTFVFATSQPLSPCIAVVLPLAPPVIHRLSPMEESRIRINKNFPQIAPIIESKIDKMVLEDLNLICSKLQTGSITLDTAVLKLRAGGFYDWATLAFIIYMFSLEQGNSFKNVPLPNQDLLSWLSGKYDSRNPGNPQCPSNPASRFERETLHAVKQICDASADENGFVMSYEDAYNLVKET